MSVLSKVIEASDYIVNITIKQVTINNEGFDYQ